MNKPTVSRRIASVAASPMRRFAPLIAAAEAAGVEVMKLNIGDPDFAAPDLFFRTLHGYDGPTVPYAPATGRPEIVAAWIRYYRRLGVRLEAANILPTTGGAEAILMSLLTVADPGDEIIVFEPLFTCFKAGAKAYNIRLTPISLAQEGGFALPPDSAIKKKITARTRAIVVINPDNPTGKLWPQAEIDRLVRLAVRHGLFLISDETYREIVFRGRPTTILKNRLARENAIVIDSLSKRFSVPGARAGALVSHRADIIAQATKLAMIRAASPTIEQLACAPLLDDSARLIRGLANEYRHRRDAVIKELKRWPAVGYHIPGGAFYLVLKLPVNGEDFVSFMLNDFRHQNRTVALTPLASFYLTPSLGHDQVRFALVKPPRELRAAVRLIGLGLAAYAAKRR